MCALFNQLEKNLPVILNLWPIVTCYMQNKNIFFLNLSICLFVILNTDLYYYVHFKSYMGKNIYAIINLLKSPAIEHLTKTLH